MIKLTKKEEIKFQRCRNCEICEKPFTLEDPKVCDHDHITGKLRFFSYRSCNIELQISPTIPTVFYNLSRYDSHFIIKDVVE